MTELSQIILQDYQVRKNQKQKDAFIALMRQYFPQMQEEVSGFPKSRNLIVGDPEKAKVLLCAHYDTCAQLPFANFITPKKPVLSLLYSALIILPAFVIVTCFSLLLARFVRDFWIAYGLTLCFYALIIWLMLAGPANQHNCNDNTSGVITLLQIYDALSPQDRDKVVLLFFDNEEKGVLGSAQFRHKHKKLIQKKLLINFDCVSDGDYILLGISKKANARYRVGLVRNFTDEGDKHILIEKLNRIYYPSDQAGFPMAIAVAALKHKKFLGYYMDKIHTKKDTTFDERNIQYLTERTVQFIERI